jgi:hypothetical protein
MGSICTTDARGVWLEEQPHRAEHPVANHKMRPPNRVRIFTKRSVEYSFKTNKRHQSLTILYSLLGRCTSHTPFEASVPAT